MLARYRTQTYLSTGSWFGGIALLLIIVALPSKGDSSLAHFKGAIAPTCIGMDLLFLAICFFWAARCLAKAKGYSPALALLGIFLLTQPFIMTALLALPDKNRQPTHGVKRAPHTIIPKIERVIRFRRNAFLGIVFGSGGITFGASLFLIPGGVFSDPSNTIVLGIFLFAAGYVGVIAGARYWLKAKHQNENLVVIGILPFGILLVPFVRLILFRVPQIIPVGMIVMPILLLIVIWSLPDYSGISKNRKA